MKINYSKWPCVNPITKKTFYVYVPIIEVFLICNHKIGRRIKSYLDTGATVNIFPWEYGTALLGFSDKTMQKGLKIPILGVGGIQIEAYGHKCSIEHPEFSLKSVMVYFVKDQPYPLLGRRGFMDKFDKIIFDETHKNLKLIQQKS